MGGITEIAFSALGWCANRARLRLDRRRTCGWLKSNTRDYPHESHVDLLRICKGTQLPEERVRRALMSDPRVYVFGKEPELLWSVWREEPESIYEKRGILRL